MNADGDALREQKSAPTIGESAIYISCFSKSTTAHGDYEVVPFSFSIPEGDRFDGHAH